MIADTIKQKKQILLKIEKAGIPRNNLYSVLLYGSHYWGYDTTNSDIDLYILVKKQQNKVKDIDDISLHYQITPQQLNKKVESGSWASYFCCRYTSYLLYGKRPNIPEYPKDKIIKYLERKKAIEINLISKDTRKKVFQNVMKRIYFLNYFYNDIHTFKLTDFQFCKQLLKSELEFLENQYVKIFKHKIEDLLDNKILRKIILKLEACINKLI